MADITDPFLIKLKAVIDADPKLTVSGLAKSAGLAQSTVRMLLDRDGQSPKLSTARSICAALGTTLEDFMKSDLTPEEQEIVRLANELPAPLRQKLLGYGQALVDGLDRRSD